MAASPRDQKKTAVKSPAEYPRSTTTTLSHQPKHPQPQPPSLDESASSSTIANEADLGEQLNRLEKLKWVKGEKIGEGTYAVVKRGHAKDDPNFLVALKKIKVSDQFRDGMTFDAIREVKCLQELNHPNIIRLHSVFSSKDQNITLVLEYLPMGNLEHLIKNTEGIRYGAADIKAWMGMLCRAVWFCHENFILHRDIKPNNLFIAANGEIKLADFGLARSFADPYQVMTTNVITLWYRPPELLLGAKHYSGAVDIWSVGTVFAEIIQRVPFLPGDSEIDQLSRIYTHLGVPSEKTWPGVTTLPGWVAPDTSKHVSDTRKRQDLVNQFIVAGQPATDLLQHMLALDPRKRITAKQVLEHQYWRTDPRPTKTENLPKKGGGVKATAEMMKRTGGELGSDAGVRGGAKKVARKLDFGASK